MNRKISEIMEEMDRLEKVEISGELIDPLKDHFKEEIESEKNDKADDEKAAKSIREDLIENNKGNVEDGQSDRI